MPTTTRLVTTAATMLLIFALSGCGQKGPLFLPPEPPEATATSIPGTEPAVTDEEEETP